jgi:phosphatidate cytidylyltransferase
MGHLYVCSLVAVIELLLFRELVRVRYNAHFDTVQNRIPFFRTTQWCWFVLSIVYTYGDFVYDVIQSNPRMHHLNRYLQYLSTVSFILYSGVLVLTISTLQPGYIKFQMNQLCWTTLVIALTVGQLKYVFHNIFNGLIW